jgi:hypothetical protein
MNWKGEMYLKTSKEVLVFFMSPITTAALVLYITKSWQKQGMKAVK